MRRGIRKAGRALDLGRVEQRRAQWRERARSEAPRQRKETKRGRQISHGRRMVQSSLRSCLASHADWRRRRQSRSTPRPPPPPRQRARHRQRGRGNPPPSSAATAPGTPADLQNARCPHRREPRWCHLLAPSGHRWAGGATCPQQHELGARAPPYTPVRLVKQESPSAPARSVHAAPSTLIFLCQAALSLHASERLCLPPAYRLNENWPYVRGRRAEAGAGRRRQRTR